MTATFPLAKPGKPGYSVAEVDDFLEVARTAYSSLPDDENYLSSEQIRRTAFRVVRRGVYSARHVDAALERLEEALVTRERERAIAELGEEGYYADVRATAQEIIDRLARPAGKKFRRMSFLARGYHPADVDLFSDRIAAYFQEGRTLPVENVRTIGFRSKFGGYH